MQYTYNGEHDHLFAPGADARIEELEPSKRVMSYGGNNLYSPSRPLTEAEQAALDKVGLPED